MQLNERELKELKCKIAFEVLDEYKRHGFVTMEGAHPSIRVNILNKLPKDRMIVALKRLRAIVQTEGAPSGIDSNEACAKFTTCSWGFCRDEGKLWSDPSGMKSLWPDAQDHIWPYAFLKEGRVAPLHYGKSCPLYEGIDDANGCFYKCRFFRRNRKNRKSKLTKAEALKLIDKRIEELENG